MQKPGTDVLTVLQLVFSALFGLLALVAAALLVVTGVMAVTRGSTMAAQPTAIFSMAWSALLVAIFLFISAGWSLARLLGHTAEWRPAKSLFVLASVLLLLWPLLVLLSGALANLSVAWLVLPPVMVLAVAVPIWWYLESGRRGLPVGRPQRTWGLVAFGALVTVPLILVAELVAIIGVLLGFGVWLSQRPDLAAPLYSLFDTLQNMRTVDPQLLQRWLKPLLNTPAVIYGTLFVIAVIAPLIEELFKPLGVWLLAGRGLTPAQGFWAGMVSGATFALLETLGTVGGATNDSAAALLLARLGTGLLHIVTAGLSGWAIAVTWKDGRYLRIAGVYLLAVLIHGLWNLFGLTLGFSPMLDPNAPTLPNSPFIHLLGQIALPALGVLIVVNLGILFWMNHRLRAQEPPPIPSETETIPEI